MDSYGSRFVMGEHGKTALILSGGAAFGAYQVGVMLALFSGHCRHTRGKGFHVDVLIGTSIGSLNAALLLSGPPHDQYRAAEYVRDVYLQELARSPESRGNGALRFRANPMNLFRPQCYVPDPTEPFSGFAKDAVFLARSFFERFLGFLFSAEDFEQRLIHLVDLGVFTSSEGFSALVSRRVNPARVRASGKELQVLAVNWRTGSLRVFRPEELTDALMLRSILASAAVPGLVPPVDIEGEPYADGGIVMNTGLRPAIDAGRTICISSIWIRRWQILPSGR